MAIKRGTASRTHRYHRKYTELTAFQIHPIVFSNELSQKSHYVKTISLIQVGVFRWPVHLEAKFGTRLVLPRL